MLPELHPQWRSLNFAELFSADAAFINTDAQNSILDPDARARRLSGQIKKDARALRIRGSLIRI